MVDDEGDHITAIRRKMNNVFSIFWNCIKGDPTCSSLTAISLGSKVNKVSCKRRIHIKLLCGVS